MPLPDNSPADPFALWNDFLHRSVAPRSKSAAPSGAAPRSPADTSALWSKFFQDEIQAWRQALPAHAESPPGELGRQLLSPWQETWMKTFLQPPAPDAFKAAARLWMEQLDALSKGFSQSMSTAGFPEITSKLLQQQLLWQSQTTEMFQQLGAALHARRAWTARQLLQLLDQIEGDVTGYTAAWARLKVEIPAFRQWPTGRLLAVLAEIERADDLAREKLSELIHEGE